MSRTIFLFLAIQIFVGLPSAAWASSDSLAVIVNAAVITQAEGKNESARLSEDVSRLSDKPVPFKVPPDLPDRPRLLWEFGDRFLDTGNLTHGFEIPTGSMWQPRLNIFGTLRTSVQTFDNVTSDKTAEWRNRFDLYANLALTQTEKILLGVRPLDENRFSEFAGCGFGDNANDGCDDEFFGLNIRALFFEGDLGSLLPSLDPGGTTRLDFGFTVGRQLLQFQEGMLLNDEIDSIGFVRNNILLPGIPKLRISGLWGWNEVDRPGARGNPRRSNKTAQMFGLFNSADTRQSTINLDIIYVDDPEPNGTGFYASLASIQRIGHFNTAFRINNSIASDTATPQVANGTLLSAEISWTPQSTDNIVYINPFITSGTFTQAGREPIVGGPLGALGILFASPSLGNFQAEMNSFANQVAGIAIGYQAFWQNHRRQLIMELAGRLDTKGADLAGGGDGSPDEAGIGFEFRQRLAQHVQLQLDGHYTIGEDRDNGYGSRLELLIQY